jgi:hypothetical protein
MDVGRDKDLRACCIILFCRSENDHGSLAGIFTIPLVTILISFQVYRHLRKTRAKDCVY